MRLAEPVTTAAVRTANDAIAPFRLGDYVPHATFLLAGPAGGHPDCRDFHERLRSAPGVLAVLPYGAELKIPPQLASAGSARSALQDSAADRPRAQALLVHVNRDIAQLEGQSAADVAQRLRAGLASAVGAAVVAGEPVVGGSIVELSVPHAHHQAASAWLSEQHDVLWVERKPRMRLENHFARLVVQDNLPSGTRFFDAQLHGEGEIIATSDTGVDYDSCFFSDPAVAVPIGR